jgi:uncharacterized coiled-coil protein SlyX
LYIPGADHVNDSAAERIESRISFLERGAEQLSETVYRQEQEILTLKAQLAALSARLAAQVTEYSPEHEKPPHY